MGVNPVTGGDRAVLIKEIKEGRRKACHDSPTFIPPLWISPPRLSSPGEGGPMVLGFNSLPCPTAAAVIQRFCRRCSGTGGTVPGSVRGKGWMIFRSAGGGSCRSLHRMHRSWMRQ